MKKMRSMFSLTIIIIKNIKNIKKSIEILYYLKIEVMARCFFGYVQYLILFSS
jgi:hypothetical protein